MGLRSQLRRHRKDIRFVVGGLGLLLLLFLAVFFVLVRNRDLPPELLANRVLLFVLWYANVVLILAIFFVLLRNIFKVLVERHHRILGSKFRTKLVATYVGLALVPVLLLFFFANQMLQGSIDRWFNVPVQEVIAQAHTVAEEYRAQVNAEVSRAAALALKEIRRSAPGPDPAPPSQALLQELLRDLGLDVLAVYEGTAFQQAAISPQSGLTDFPEPRWSLLRQGVETGKAVGMQAPPGVEGRLALAAVREEAAGEEGRPGEAEGEAPAALMVVAGRVLSPRAALPSEELLLAYQAHRQLMVQKEEIKASHLLLFLMVTLLILLASSWVGLYLARRVTVPIQALAEGTRRISEGELGHRVDVAADDELEVLVASFNRMTEELERKEALLAQRNEELVAINKRKAKERALIAAVLRNVAAGVISIDREGCVFTCNGAAQAMLRQGEEILGQPVAEVWRDGERAKLATLLEESAGHVRLSRQVHLLLGGEWKTFEVKVTAMDGAGENGGGGGRVMVLEDLTELLKAQNLAAWNEAARRIAHEIKNPLTPIKLSAERLRMKCRLGDPRLAQAIEEGVEIIVREVGTMQSMVDEFSRFARMPQPQPARVDLPRLLEETVHLYQDLKPGVEVVGRVAGEVEAVWLDPEQLKGALINLLDNAVEATEPPGRVSVAAERRDGRLLIHVADTGRGIPAKSKEKLFLPYFSTKGRGTGLGLAIVHRVVSDHKGHIRVSDNRPHGTVFTLDFPLS